jgi:lipopolysaccharide/colanic/teichoic acid biosynthesis glycosyltransferase
MTGLWQVSGRSDVGFQSMCILDIYYLRNSGLLLDLKIALRTVIGVLFARGAY